MTATQRSHDRFAATRWSTVMRPGAQSSDAQGALTELAQRYWYPVYAYVRCSGNDPDSAREIARGFLLHLPGLARAGEPSPAHGHFRRYLLARLDDFLAADWREEIHDEPSAALQMPPSDLEARYQCDNAHVTSPEQAYQRAFAIEVIARAFGRLRNEARSTGHLDMYEALQPHLGNDPPSGFYEQLARKLQTRPLVLIVALKRLRQRFRELVGEELGDTVASAQDLTAELEALHAVLRELPS